MINKTVVALALSGALIASSTSAFSEESLTVGVSGKSAGDVIAVLYDYQIAKWCDFDKSIVVTNRKVLCIYNGKQ